MTRNSTAIATTLIAVQGITATGAFAASPWDMIGSVEVEEIITDTSYEARKTFPKGMEERIEGFDITGYVITWTEENVTEFILISDMGFCPFCGDPEHGTSLEIRLSSAVAELREGERVTLRGALVPVTDTQTSQSAILVDAELVQ